MIDIEIAKKIAGAGKFCHSAATAERWQSGLTRTPGKREYPKGIGGSNPPLSASLIQEGFELRRNGERIDFNLICPTDCRNPLNIGVRPKRLL